MRFFLPILLGVVVLLSQTALLCAEETTLPLANGLSPDGKYEAILLAEGPDPDWGFDVVIREKGKSKNVVMCECGYGYFKNAPDDISVLWNDNSHFVAISTRGTKNTTNTYIFFIDGQRSTQFRPSIDFLQNINGRLGILKAKSYSVVPLAWSVGSNVWAKDILKVEVSVFPEAGSDASNFAVEMACPTPEAYYPTHEADILKIYQEKQGQ